MTSRVDHVSDTVTKELDEARSYLLAETEPKGLHHLPVLRWLVGNTELMK